MTILLLVATHTAPATAQVTISGQVLDANGAGVDNVVVSLHFSDGTSSLPYTTPIGGTYQFANVNAPGQSMWIEYTKLGTGHKEIHDLSERTSQNLGVVLGLPPKAAGGIVPAPVGDRMAPAPGGPNSPRTSSRPLRGPTCAATRWREVQRLARLSTSRWRRKCEPASGERPKTRRNASAKVLENLNR